MPKNSHVKESQCGKKCSVLKRLIPNNCICDSLKMLDEYILHRPFGLLYNKWDSKFKKLFFTSHEFVHSKIGKIIDNVGFALLCSYLLSPSGEYYGCNAEPILVRRLTFIVNILVENKDQYNKKLKIHNKTMFKAIFVLSKPCFSLYCEPCISAYCSLKAILE